MDEGLLYTRLRYGVNLSQARPDLAIRHAHVPILLIHGTGDRETVPEHSERLAKANPSLTELWLVPGAGHTGAYATAPKEFEEKVLQWFGRARVNETAHIRSATTGSIRVARRAGK